MAPYGSLWLPVALYGSLWITMDHYGSLRINMAFHDSLYLSMTSYGSLLLYDSLLLPIAQYSFSWQPMAPYGFFSQRQRTLLNEPQVLDTYSNLVFAATQTLGQVQLSWDRSSQVINVMKGQVRS